MAIYKPGDTVKTTTDKLVEAVKTSPAISDRVKYNYSNQYALIIDRSSFYNASDSDEAGTNSVESVILQQSAAPGSAATEATRATSTDPFRQCMGYMWTYRTPANSEAPDASVGFLETTTSEPTIPSAYIVGNNGGSSALKFENISSLWSDIFGAGSYENSMNLPRKATRVKVFLGEDVLQSKLTMLSLLTDINRKNSNDPYADIINKINEETSSFGGMTGGSWASPDLNFPSDAYNIDLLGDDSPGPFLYKAALDKKNLRLNNQHLTPSQYDITWEEYKTSTFEDDILLSYYEGIWDNTILDLLTDTIDKGQMGAIYDFSNWGVKNNYAHDKLFYNDAAFSMQTPMSPSALELTSETNKSILYADIKPVYNYYSKFYEEATTKEKLVSKKGTSFILSERELPAIYSVPIDKAANNDTPSPLTDNVYSKFNFESYGHGLLSGKVVLKDNDSYRHIILDQTNKEYIQNFDSIKKQFPFYADFEFNSPTKKAFTSIFNKSGITDLLIKTWISNIFSAKNQAGDSVRSPSKASTIGPDKARYYNIVDPDPLYKEMPFTNSTEEEKIPAICSSEIYSIRGKKSFFNLVAPQESEDSTMQGGIIGNQGEIMFREFDLNKFLDGYIKFLFNSPGTWTKVSKNPRTAEEAGSTDNDGAWTPTGNSSMVPNGDDPRSTGTNGDDPRSTGTNGETPLETGELEYKDFIESLYLSSNPGLRLYSDPEDGNYRSFSPNSAIAALNAFSFISDYQKLIDQCMRDYEQILNKHLSYNETMFYRIQKVPLKENGEPSNSESNPVQHFWIPVPNDTDNASDVLKYVDTQVKYDQRYEYTIYAYQIVVGSKYGFQFGFPHSIPGFHEKYYNNFYQSAESEGFKAAANEWFYRGAAGNNPLFSKAENSTGGSPSARNLAMFDVVCESDVKLVEVPVYKKVISIGDSPPAPPEVDIVPLRGKKNDIKINFYPGTIGNEMEPVFIDYKNDIPRFDAIRKAQDRDLKKLGAPEKIEKQSNYVYPALLFKSDDSPMQYEIYRVTQPPKDYSSFRNDSTSRKSTKTVIDAIEASSYTDKLENNRKYYYIFRTIDIHGNPSNPSPVYQVEMVENSGVTYPIISVYEFPIKNSQKLGSKAKSFKRYLKIDVDPMQSKLNIQESTKMGISPQSALDLVKKPKLGPRRRQVFSDADSTNPVKYKFRIKSKHTGKIMDLNVSFKSRVVESADGIVSFGTKGKPAPQNAEVKGSFPKVHEEIT